MALIIGRYLQLRDYGMDTKKTKLYFTNNYVQTNRYLLQDGGPVSLTDPRDAMLS